MSLIDLIQSDEAAAQKAVAETMQSKVFDYLDNYVLENRLDELSSDTLNSYRNVRIKQGNVDKSKPHPGGEKAETGIQTAYKKIRKTVSKTEPMNPQSWGDKHGGKY